MERVLLPLHTPAPDDDPNPTSWHQGRRDSGKRVKRIRVKGIGPGHSLPPETWLLMARSLQRKPHLSDSSGLERPRKRQEDVTGGSRLGAKTKKVRGRAGRDEGEATGASECRGNGWGRTALSPAVSSKRVKPEEKGSRAHGVALGTPREVGCTHPGGVCFTQT